MRLDHGTWQICSEVRWYLALLWRLGTARQCGPRLTDHGTFFWKWGEWDGTHRFHSQNGKIKDRWRGFLKAFKAINLPSPYDFRPGYDAFTLDQYGVLHNGRAGLSTSRAEPGCEISTALARWGISWCCWVCCSDEGRLDFARIKGNQLTLPVDFVKSIHCAIPHRQETLGNIPPNGVACMGLCFCAVVKPQPCSFSGYRNSLPWCCFSWRAQSGDWA